MEMTIVIALLIVISVFAGIKLRMEYKNNDRIRSIKALCDYQSGFFQSINERVKNLEGSKKNILFIIDMLYERINNLEKNTLSRKPTIPPPPDSFFRKPSESSPRK